MSNAIASPDVYHQATTGQYGIVKLLTGQLSDLGVNFFSIKSGKKNSSFKADLGGKYDQTFTWNLDKGDYILGPFYNIRDVVGVLDCYPLKSKSSIKKNPFYLAENGVTVILKDNFPAGSSGKVDGDNSGKIYTAVNEAQLRALNVNTFDYTSVCTTLVTDMGSLFNTASTFNQRINTWDVSNVTDMGVMFNSALAFNQPLNSWNVANVTNMNDMFNSALAFNQPLNSWNVSQVTDMNRMFRDSNLSTENLTAIYENWPQLTLQQNVTFSAGTIKYNASGQAGRNLMINTYNWIITDGDQA
jgi:surface protein